MLFDLDNLMYDQTDTVTVFRIVEVGRAGRRIEWKLAKTILNDVGFDTGD